MTTTIISADAVAERLRGADYGPALAACGFRFWVDDALGDVVEVVLILDHDDWGQEAIDACGLEDTGDDLDKKAGEKLLYDLSAEAILITQGEKGMILFQPDSKIHRFDALARKVYDVTGAGDTVIATLAVGIGASLNFVEAAEIANIAAGLVVEKVGTTAINREMLERALEI